MILKLTLKASKKKRISFDVKKFAFKFNNAFKIKDINDAFPGDVSMGLCGGMSAGALHRFKYDCCSPPDPNQTKTPHKGKLFDELFERQLITLSDGQLARIWDWQRSPDLPHTHTPTSLRKRQKGQWKVLKSAIDHGEPVILCLIREEGYLASIWKNHQVVAIGYEYDPTIKDLKVEIYDPNDNNQSNFLYLCLGGGRLGAHQIDSRGNKINFRAFFVMTTTNKASEVHI